MPESKIQKQLALGVATKKTHYICLPHLTGGEYPLSTKASTECKSPGCSNPVHAGLNLCLDCAERDNKCQICSHTPTGC